MEIINVLAAAAASWIFGAGWYMALSKPWIEAVKIEVDENGRPAGDSALPYILSGLCMLIVAGTLRHVLAMSGITSIGGGAITGFGVGAFFISPWIMINNAYGMRPFKLTLIDGGYAIFGCTIMGIVLNLF